jgi:hypothetical protein
MSHASSTRAPSGSTSAGSRGWSIGLVSSSVTWVSSSDRHWMRPVRRSRSSSAPCCWSWCCSSTSRTATGSAESAHGPAAPPAAALRRVGEQAWLTLGAFFRGQLLIALVDAVAIGIGLALLRVPLALPLAVVVFFGGLFPIVGAVTAGALAVLVALAHGGLGLGLVVLALIVGVQQLEGNVLEPFILGHVVKLHPLIVVLAVTAGAITFGVLGAFLAVPVVAVTGQAGGSDTEQVRPV